MTDTDQLYARLPTPPIMYKPFIPPPRLGPPAPPTYGPALPTQWDRVEWALTTAELTPDQRAVLEDLRDEWEAGY